MFISLADKLNKIADLALEKEPTQHPQLLPEDVAISEAIIGIFDYMKTNFSSLEMQKIKTIRRAMTELRFAYGEVVKARATNDITNAIREIDDDMRALLFWLQDSENKTRESEHLISLLESYRKLVESRRGGLSSTTHETAQSVDFLTKR